MTTESERFKPVLRVWILSHYGLCINWAVYYLHRTDQQEFKFKKNSISFAAAIENIDRNGFITAVNTDHYAIAWFEGYFAMLPLWFHRLPGNIGITYDSQVLRLRMIGITGVQWQRIPGIYFNDVSYYSGDVTSPWYSNLIETVTDNEWEDRTYQWIFISYLGYWISTETTIL